MSLKLPVYQPHKLVLFSSSSSRPTVVAAAAAATTQPVGFRKSYIVPIPKPKDCRSKSMKYDDFRGITISPVISKKNLSIV